MKRAHSKKSGRRRKICGAPWKLLTLPYILDLASGKRGARAKRAETWRRGDLEKRKLGEEETWRRGEGETP
jgi:hypothetical protein